MASAQAEHAGAHIPGKAHQVNVWFGGANNYFTICDAVADNDYEGFALQTPRSTPA